MYSVTVIKQTALIAHCTAFQTLFVDGMLIAEVAPVFWNFELLPQDGLPLQSALARLHDSALWAVISPCQNGLNQGTLGLLTASVNYSCQLSDYFVGRISCYPQGSSLLLLILLDPFSGTYGAFRFHCSAEISIQIPLTTLVQCACD